VEGGRGCAHHLVRDVPYLLLLCRLSLRRVCLGGSAWCLWCGLSHSRGVVWCTRLNLQSCR
jgi:hypothetical protein